MIECILFGGILSVDHHEDCCNNSGEHLKKEKVHCVCVCFEKNERLLTIWVEYQF